MNERNDLVQPDNNETTSTPLQPMSFVDILDGVFSLYRSHWALFLGITGVYFILVYGMDLITIFVFVNAAPSTTVVVGLLASLGSYAVIFGVVAGLVYAGAEVYLNRELTSQAALRQAGRRFWSYIGSVILWLLVVCGLFITIIGIPFSIYFGVRWGLYGLPVMVEGTTARQALRRSTELVKGTWWRVFGIMLAIFLISIMIQFIFQTSFLLLTQVSGTTETSLWETFRQLFFPSFDQIEWRTYAIQRFVVIGIAALTMPVNAIGSMLLYFDLRIRKEAFDIEMQVANVESNQESPHSE